MIHLIAIQTSPGVWKITTSDMVEKYPDVTAIAATMPIPEKAMQDWMDDMRLNKEIKRPDRLIKKMRELGKEWGEDQPHWTVIYDKEPE